jgi:hypothetical protein
MEMKKQSPWRHSMKKTRAMGVLLFSAALLFVCVQTAPAITEQTIYPWGTFAGSGAGAVNATDAYYNAFFGYEAGNANIDGGNNTFAGAMSGRNNTSGNYNTFIGRGAGYGNLTGNNNTFIGANTADSSDVETGNTYIGSSAGHDSLGYGNVFIGNSAGYFETDGSNMLYIANSETNSPLIYGEFDNKIVEINGNLVCASSERLKKNIEPLKESLNKVMRLKGVSFEWKTGEERGKGRNIGLIAQDVETVIPELVHTGAKGRKSLSYDKFSPYLVEAIKEQQAVINKHKERLASKSMIAEAQQKELDEQEAVIKDLAVQLASLRAEVNKLKSRDMTAQK